MPRPTSSGHIDPEQYHGATRWVLRRARSGAAAPVLFAAGVADSSVLPMPLEVALALLMVGARRRIPIFLAATLIGAVVGAAAMYALGAFAMDAVGHLLGAGLTQSVQDAADRIRDAGFAAVVLGGLTPFPWPVVALGAGVGHIPLPVFLAGAAIGRGVRFAAIALGVALFGDRALAWWVDAPRWAQAGFWIAVTLIGLIWLGFALSG